jgi:hypothetical protein
MKYAFIKTAFASACLTAGISVAKQTERSEVERLVRRVHPLTTDRPLIRLGANADGGYLVPDDLEGIAACFSPGVDNRATFETSLIERGIPCFMADASVENAPINGSMAHFTRKFLGAIDDANTITLDEWVNAHRPGSNDLLLQIDIEGAEWPVMLNVSPATLARFRIIVIEFHELGRLIDKHAFPIIKATFDRLLDKFYVVHSHPNNFGRSVRCGGMIVPLVMEMTFIRKDRVKIQGFARTFPNPLDVTNDIENPDLTLPPSWFHQGR